MKYKVLKHICGALATMMTFSSCSDLLTETPSSGYDRDVFFDTVDRVEAAVLGVYGAISNNTHYGWYQMALPASDDMYLTNRTTNDNQIHDIVHYTPTASNAWVQTLWLQKYTALNRVNLAISGVESMDDFPTEQRLLELDAELRFLRAFISYDLVVNWGDVPYKTTSTDDYGSAFGPRRDRREILDIMMDDLEFAVANLPWRPTGYPERPGQGAARAMLMRVMLQRAGYSLSPEGKLTRPDDSERTALFRKVLSQWNEFETEGSNGFHPGGYADYFIKTSAGIPCPEETLWEISMTHEQGRLNGSAWGIYNGPAVAAPSGLSVAETANYMARANGMFIVVPEWKDFYEEADERRDVNICDYQYSWDATKKQHVKKTKKSTGWYVGKWRREWMSPESWSKNINYGDVNFCPLRYADVVLMAAEAANEVGENALAWELINRVRTRSGASAVDAGTYESVMAPVKSVVDINYLDDSTEQGKIRTMLYFERGRELAYEGQRKYDLIRWGILGDALRLFGTVSVLNSGSNLMYPACRNFTDGKNELLPIPLKELQSNPLLGGVNNPGF